MRTLLRSSPFFALVLATACGGPEGEPQVVGTYRQVRTSGAVDLQIEHTDALGPDEARWTCPDADARLSLQVEDEVLIVEVSADGDGPCLVGVHAHDLHGIELHDAPAEVTVTVDQDVDLALERLEADQVFMEVGAQGHLVIDELVATSVDVDMTGGGELQVGALLADSFGLWAAGNTQAELQGVDTTTFALDLQGTTWLRAAGVTEHLRIVAAGNATADCGGLAADTAEVEASGSAAISIDAHADAALDVAGSATVELVGGVALP